MKSDAHSLNVHQRYVNAALGDGEIPAYFSDRFDNDQRVLVQKVVFREMWYGEELVHSIGSLEPEYDAGRHTVRSRLDEMFERGILEKGSINNGDYWWIDFPESDHPLPKDVVVHPTPEWNEMTVDEFVTQPHVSVGAVALLATVIGGALVLIGAFPLAGNSPLRIPAAAIHAGGLWVLFASYLTLLAAFVVWVTNRVLDSRPGGVSLYFGDD